MSNPFEKVEPCWAGRKAFLGGKWQVPCQRSMNPTHIITDPNTPGAPEIKLCTYHYEWAEQDGFVDDPNPTPEQVAAYEARDADLYDAARRATDEVMGEGSYARINCGNPDPRVQAAIERGKRGA